MPKLGKQLASAASAEADSWSDRTLLEPGQYVGRLVKVTPKEGKTAPYWVWEYDIEGSTNKVWDNTSLSERAIGRLGKVFEAFGVSTATDTDLLVGKKVGLQIGHRTIQAGERQGEKTHTVESVFPVARIAGYKDTSSVSKATDFGIDDDEPF